jgi:hypothetical protein
LYGEGLLTLGVHVPHAPHPARVYSLSIERVFTFIRTATFFLNNLANSDMTMQKKLDQYRGSVKSLIRLRKYISVYMLKIDSFLAK